MELSWDNEHDDKAETQKNMDALVSSIDEYNLLCSRIEELNARKKDIEQNILDAYFPQAKVESGEWVRVADTTLVRVKRGDRWTWDSKKLEEKFGIEPPDFVKRSYGCDKRVFEKLPKETQDELIFALTKNLGTLKIESEKVSDET